MKHNYIKSQKSEIIHSCTYYIIQLHYLEKKKKNVL